MRDFAKKVRKNLETLGNNEYYVVLYLGETIMTFQEQWEVTIGRIF